MKADYTVAEVVILDETPYISFITLHAFSHSSIRGKPYKDNENTFNDSYY